MTTYARGTQLRVTASCCSFRVGELGTADGDGYFRRASGSGSSATTHAINSGPFQVELVPNLEVDKWYRVTGPLQSVQGNRAFRGDVPPPTEVKVLRLFDSGNAYVENRAGVHQHLAQSSLGAEAVASATPAAPTLVVGQEYRLLPGDTDHFFRGTTRVRLLNLPSEGSENAYVRRLDGTGGPDQFVRVTHLGALEEAPAAPLELVVGQEYTLLPNPTYRGEVGNQFFKPEVTRVRVESLDWDGEPTSVRVVAVNGGPRINSMGSNRYIGEGNSQTVDRVCLAALDGTEVTLADPKDVEIERLKRDLEAARQRAQEATSRHIRDIELLGEKLIEAANDADLCEQFDSFVDRVNRDLLYELPEREREFEVEFTFTQTITVMARDAESAEETARETDEYKNDGDYGSLYEQGVDVTEQ